MNGTYLLHNDSETMPRGNGQIHWAHWLPHRLCSPETTNESQFTIQTITRAKRELRLNYPCGPGSWGNAEMLSSISSRLHPDVEGVAGFTFEECHRLPGHPLDQMMTWQGNSDISAVGETVAIQLKMGEKNTLRH